MYPKIGSSKIRGKQISDLTSTSNKGKVDDLDCSSDEDSVQIEITKKDENVYSVSNFIYEGESEIQDFTPEIKTTFKIYYTLVYIAF